ncbi:MAG: hypothetical protein ABI036_07700 [Fibrobacteria bacterium]
MPSPLLINPFRIPILIGLALAAIVVADPAPETSKLKGWLVTGGASLYGATAGLKYRPRERAIELGARAAYFPSAHAYDGHVFILNRRAVFPTYWGPELSYVHDSGIFTNREFRSFETLSLQGIVGKEFPLTPRFAFACEGGGGVILWQDYDFQGDGVPIVLPISLIIRAEFLFRL